MYSKLNSKVRTSKGLSETFLQQCGVMQGDSLSPSRFVISINEIETIINDIPFMGVFVENRNISVLKYAADVVLWAVTGDSLQLGLNALRGFCAMNHLTVNTSKR